MHEEISSLSMAHEKRTQATMYDTVLKEDKLGWKDSLGACWHNPPGRR